MVTNSATDPLSKNKRKLKLILIGFGLLVIFIPISAFLINHFQRPSTPPSLADFPQMTPYTSSASAFVANQLIVKYKEASSPAELTDNNEKDAIAKLYAELGVSSQLQAYPSTDNPDLKEYYLLEFKAGSSLSLAKQTLSQLKEVETVDLNPVLSLQATQVAGLTNDLYSLYQWNLGKINIAPVWKAGYLGSDKVGIAILDSGLVFPQKHPDLPSNIIHVTKPDDYNQAAEFYGTAQNDHVHGTVVTGIIGAIKDNHQGISGVSPMVQIYSYQVCRNEECDSLAASQALESIAQSPGKVKVVNLSLGAPSQSTPSEPVCPDWVQGPINDLTSKGILVVAGVGNGDFTTGNRVGIDAKNFIPASCKGVLGVAATNANDQKASYSNYGSVAKISAPGGENEANGAILSTIPFGDIPKDGQLGPYGKYFGTSMATPQVSAVAALLFSANPDLTVDKIKQCLTEGGDPVSNLDPKQPIGPRLNAAGAFNTCGIQIANTTTADAKTATPPVIQPAQPKTPPPPPPPVVSKSILPTLPSTNTPTTQTPTSVDLPSALFKEVKVDPEQGQLNALITANVALSNTQTHQYKFHWCANPTDIAPHQICNDITNYFNFQRAPSDGPTPNTILNDQIIGQFSPSLIWQPSIAISDRTTGNAIYGNYILEVDACNKQPDGTCQNSNKQDVCSVIQYDECVNYDHYNVIFQLNP